MDLEAMTFSNHRSLVWYLAYGSNMSRDKFTGDRGIVPHSWARVRIPGWQLAFNIPGLPYSEPSFTSIVPKYKKDLTSTCKRLGFSEKPSSDIKQQVNKEPFDVLGVAYLITQEQYIKVFASEGGGTAYRDIQVSAVPVNAEDAARTGGNIRVRTLGNVPGMVREPWPKPSQRYMNLITFGAHAAQMPQYWQKYLEHTTVYQPPVRGINKAGAKVFLALWGPIMKLLEVITNASIGQDGYAPDVVIWLVRVTIWLIWFSHDTVFAPIFGRGYLQHDE